MTSIRLRPATRADVPLLEEWDREPHVAASTGDDDWGWESLLEGALPGLENYVAEAGGRPVGVIQITDPDKDASRYWGDMPPGLRAVDIWIGPADALGVGYGTAMMREALRLCFIDPEVNAVLIDPLVSNTNAIRFYRRIGFTFLENRWFGDDQCAVHQITRDTFQASQS